VVAITNTHLVEFNNGLIVRSFKLGDDVMFTKVRVLTGNMACVWLYVLEGGGKVIFINGDTLQVTREFDEVEGMDIGDFLNTGKSLVKIMIFGGELVLTDGENEYDLYQEWPVIENPEEGDVGKVLEQRLTMSREAVVRAKAELEMTTRLVNQSMKEMMVSCGMEEWMELSDVEQIVGGGTLKSKEETKKAVNGLVIMEHWVKFVRGDILVGLEVETVGGEVSDIQLQLVTVSGELNFSSCMVKIVKRGGRINFEKILKLGTDGVRVKGTLVAKMPFSSLNPSTPLTLLASVSYTLSLKTRRLHTETLRIFLKPKDFCSESMSPTFTSPASAIQSVISLYLTGIRESLCLSTLLGSLKSFPDFLSKLSFIPIVSISGYLLDKPSHPLHLSIILLYPVNSRKIDATIYSKDYSLLSLLVRMLREILPADVTFQRVEKAYL